MIKNAPRAAAVLVVSFAVLFASMMVNPGDNDGLQGLPFLVLGLPWSLFIPEALPFDEGRPLIAVLAACTAFNGYLLLVVWSLVRRHRVRS